MVAAAVTNALVAAARFGYAPRPGELAAIAGDPRGWVLKQLDAAPVRLDPALPNSAVMVAEMLQFRKQRKDLDDTGRKAENQRLRALYLAEIAARTNAAVATDAPLLERLTRFWSNHFTVSCVRPFIRGFAAAFEREAIRPYVAGRFVDMLLAAERHPAMLFYLDQVLSIGPNSIAGRRLHRGINENLGREMLELHTVGVDSYTQADVDALANILTGWSIARLNLPDPGTFRFYPALHEPGPQTLLGKTYPEAGYEQGEMALRDLAAHPATAQHIAFKLARHFIADAPPPAAVQRIAAVFRDTGGDLKRVTAAVVTEEAAWQDPFAKVRTPDELVVAASRVTGFTPPSSFIVETLHILDQQPFFAPSPAGWPDTAGDWVGPEAVLHRADWCEAFAARLSGEPDPAGLADAAFGDALRAPTVEAIRRAASRREGVALLIASPEFQRR